MRGRLSQTKYILHDTPLHVRITRRYHPLENQQVDVLSARGRCLVVKLSDGSTTRIPRVWTDADGHVPQRESAENTLYSVEGLRELMDLLEILRARF